MAVKESLASAPTPFSLSLSPSLSLLPSDFGKAHLATVDRAMNTSWVEVAAVISRGGFSS